MHKQPRCLLALAAGLMLVSSAAAQDPSDQLARAAAEQFAKAVTAEDVEAVLKVCAYPFFMDGKKNIQEQAELRREFVQVFEEKDLTRYTCTVREVHAFEKVRDQMSEKDQELLKDVLQKGDRVVILEVKAGDKAEKVWLMVRVRAGQAKVAGLRD